jgi:hypothetical protein
MGKAEGVTDPRDSDATRLALAMVRADWQEDEDGWNQLWAVTDDPGQLARELTRLCREQLDRLAAVAGVSTAEMLHRMAAPLIPHPDLGHVSLVDLEPKQPSGS